MAGAIAISNFNQKTAGLGIQPPSVADAPADGCAQGKTLTFKVFLGYRYKNSCLYFIKILISL